MLAIFLVTRRTKRPLNDSEEKYQGAIVEKGDLFSWDNAWFRRFIYVCCGNRQEKAGDSFVGQILSRLIIRWPNGMRKTKKTELKII